MRVLLVAGLILGLATAAVAQDDGLRARAMAAYEAQDWESARSLLRTARVALPDDRELPLLERTAAQNVAGAHFNAERYGDALAMLDEAEGIDAGAVPPHVAQHAASLRELAVAELAKRGQPPPPRRVPTTEHRVRPEDSPAIVPVAEPAAQQRNARGVAQARTEGQRQQELEYQAFQLESSGDVAGALALAKEGLSSYPTSIHLNRIVGSHDPAALGDRSRRARVESGHFVLKFRGIEPDAAVESSMIEALAAAEATLTREFGFTLERTTNVVVYASGQDFHRSPGAASWSEANYNGSVQLPVETARMERAHFNGVVAHELTHHMVALLSRNRCPTWFNEGLAQMAGGQTDADERLRDVLADPARRSSLYRLAELKNSMSPNGDTSRVGLAYAQSYSVVKMMVDRHGIAAATGLLADLSGGANMETAFQGRTGKSVAEFEKEWLAGRLAEYGL